jgi:hypothetical protein
MAQPSDGSEEPQDDDAQFSEADAPVNDVMCLSTEERKEHESQFEESSAQSWKELRIDNQNSENETRSNASHAQNDCLESEGIPQTSTEERIDQEQQHIPTTSDGCADLKTEDTLELLRQDVCIEEKQTTTELHQSYATHVGEEEDEEAPLVEILEAKGRVVHILGTAHVSKKSCTDVSEVIQRVRPQVRHRVADKVYEILSATRNLGRCAASLCLPRSSLSCLCTFFTWHTC